MVKRVDKLTRAQKARMAEWADHWIEIGLRTGKADRKLFEAAARQCYEFAGIPWPARVVWVSSPIIMAIAAPVAALFLQYKKHGAVGGAVGDAVSGAVRDAVSGAVRDAVIRQQIADIINKAWTNYIGGQFWLGGWYWGAAYTSFFRDVCDLELSVWDRGIAYESTVQSACWWYPHRDFVMVVERPAVIRRESTRPEVTRGWNSHRLHCADGPAVGWADGWGVYAIHGVRIPFWQRHIVEHPERITLAEFTKEGNAEVRRVMIERYGEDRHIVDSGMKPIAHDEVYGTLYESPLKEQWPNARVIRVVNRTAEPDGTFKPYFLNVNGVHYGGDAGRVPQAAVASTWRDAEGKLAFRDYRDYKLAAES